MAYEPLTHICSDRDSNVYSSILLDMLALMSCTVGVTVRLSHGYLIRPVSASAAAAALLCVRMTLESIERYKALYVLLLQLPQLVKLPCCVTDAIALTPSTRGAQTTWP